MMRHVVLPILMIAMLGLVSCTASNSQPVDNLTPEDWQPQVRPSTGHPGPPFGFMAGTWRAKKRNGTIIEEHWTNDDGGCLLGTNREITRHGETSFEFLRIAAVEFDGGLRFVYFAQPSGRCPPTEFPLVDLEPGRLVFANPDHGFPQRITYERGPRDGDVATLIIEVTGVIEDRSRTLRWHLRRVDP